MISRMIEKEGFDLDRYPDSCPVCSHGVEPIELKSLMVRSNDDVDPCVQIVYQCPRKKCHKAFIAEYRRTSHGVSRLKLARLYPKSFQEPEIEKEIQGISPLFREIFSQASYAETLGLDQIAGMGYRKSLEFLLKDYCCAKEPDNEDKIRSELLGQVISNRVDDPNVKECARRASWLGNDQTHYTKKWECKDIEDLKVLIKLTSYWVQSSLLSQKYIQDMSD